MTQLPPKYIITPAAIAYGTDNCIKLPASVRMTWIMLRGLAWGRSSINITMQDMTEVTRLERSAVYAHLRLLRDCGSLLWASHGKDEFQLRFPEDDKQSIFLDWSSSSSLNINLPINNNNLPTTTDNSLLIPRAIQKTGRQSNILENSNGWYDVILPDLCACLDEINVTRTLFPEIADAIRSGAWSVPALMQLAETSKAGSKPGGLFIHRLRNEQPPQVCAECGQTSGHRASCSKSEYAEYINR